MKLSFDLALSGYAWTGPAASRDAALGEAWLGEAGLLDILETQLGLGGRYESDLVRAAGLVPAITSTDGFWSASAEVDPTGVAGVLLAWRDELWMNGWRGEDVAPRLGALAQVTAHVSPGLPDRLLAVARTIANHAIDIELILLHDALEDHPPAWQAVLRRLQDKGVVVEQRSWEETPAEGDLLGARSSGFSPAGDGSLQLVRSAGPLQAAEDVAAFLAAKDDLDGVVLVGADGVLDAALYRHGLPSTGGSAPHYNAMGQLLPLTLAVGWDPPDPEKVLELLSLPIKPIRNGVARQLIAALQQWPAVGSPSWEENLEKSLGGIEDEKQRETQRQRIADLLQPTVRGELYPVAEIERRVGVLTGWLGARMQFVDDDVAPWARAIHQCRQLSEAIRATGLTELTEPQLKRALEDTSASADADSPYPAGAGLASVSGPSAIAGEAQVVVWWNFTRDSAPQIGQLPLTDAERTALEGADVMLPDPGGQAIRNARRWRRPLNMARRQLLLVCPTRDESNEALFPHPLWDEIVAGMSDDTGAALLQRDSPVAGDGSIVEERTLLPLPSARRYWKVTPSSLPDREQGESPSSVETLIGCSLRWALHYIGKVRSGASSSLPSDFQLFGSLAHLTMEKTLEHGLPDSPATAAEQAGDYFDEMGPKLAPALFQPGTADQRARVRQDIVAAAAELTRQLRAAGLNVKMMEDKLQGQAAGMSFSGYPDMVTGPDIAVVDLKWSGCKGKRERLEKGTASQLASYAYLLREGIDDPFPPVAYFILSEQRLLTTDAETFPEAEHIEGAPPDETWLAFRRAWEAAVERLKEGQLEAPAVPDEEGMPGPDTTAVVDGVMVRPPTCKYCELGSLCGASFREES